MDCTCEECDRYEAGIKQVCEEAIDFFHQRVLSEQDIPHLVIFDIDGTALDDSKKGHRSSISGAMKRHEPVYLLYEKVKSSGYKIIFLTGREITFEVATKANLVEEGCVDPDV